MVKEEKVMENIIKIGTVELTEAEQNDLIRQCENAEG